MKKIITMFYITQLLLGCQNSVKANLTFEGALTKAIENSCWILEDEEGDINSLSIEFFENNNFKFVAVYTIYDVDFKSYTKTSEYTGVWEIKEDYILGRKENNEVLRWNIANDFSTISRNGSIYELCKGKKMIEQNLDDLKIKYKYSENKEIVTDEYTQVSSQESNNITENIPLKNESNYKIRVKEGVKNVNVRDNYIVDESKVLTRISYLETYTVTKEKIIGNSENAIYLLNRKTQLTDVNNGQSYTFEKGKKVKLLTTQGQHYNAEIELDNKTIITNIPVVNVERQDIQKWLYLKELNGWILSKFVEETNENKAEKIAIGTVTIGSQTWASKDLSVTNYSNGDPIFEAKTDRQWEQFGKDRVGCYRILGNGTFVYNGYALKNKKGLIPYGFSVPKKSDFETLYMYLGGEKIASEKAVKSLITYNWSEEREDLVNGGIVDVVLKGNNSSGFNARLGGFVYDHGLAQDGNFNFWWTVSSGGDNQLILSSIGGTNTDMGGSRFDSVPFSFGCAIRLIKN